MSATEGKNQIAAEFDAKAGSYEDNRLAPWYQAQARAVLREIADGPDGAVLDIGCGTGWLLRHAVEAHAGLSGIGIDLSPEMIRVARAKASRTEKVLFHLGDWERDAFELPPIRYAVCVSAMHYFDDPANAFRRVHAALEAGGSLFVLDRAREGSLVTRAWDLLHRTVIRDECRFYSTAELFDLIESAGFTEPRIVSKIEKWFWHGKMHTSLALLHAEKKLNLAQ